MSKAFGVLIIGLGIVLMVIGFTGSQHNVLAQFKSINPKLRNATNSAGNSGKVSGGEQSGGPVIQSPVQAM